MPILVTTTKGGAGATVVAASMGLSPTHDVVLVDTAGDLGAAFGHVPADAIGLDDWLRSDAPAHRLDELVLPLTPRSGLLPWSVPGCALPDSLATRWHDLMAWCHGRERAGATVVIDAGDHAEPLRQASGDGDSRPPCTELVVTRACYLALRSGRRAFVPADAVVVVAEPGRTLRRPDVQRTLGGSVVATVPWDPAIARAVDAGLSVTAPRSMARLGCTVLDACAEHPGHVRGAA